MAEAGGKIARKGSEASMKEELEVFVTGFEHLTPDERYRARRADAIYEAAFAEAGLKLDAFQRLPAWVAYVRGLIDEIELWETAVAEREKPEGSLAKAA
jgi:hypothetical protein